MDHLGGDTSLAFNLYNPTQHAFLSNVTTAPGSGAVSGGDAVVYFSGTFCTSFAPERHKTPGYDYNSLMYRLDLSAIWD